MRGGEEGLEDLGVTLSWTSIAGRPIQIRLSPADLVTDGG